ncbi:hypothetical protein [Streptomyces profundus]|uniref:hypothetical protein n=1 Tax=Streptomyces profundus TaxID=2867410 RepID=UPI001D1680BF|nr:hypothetical protein [Streptomyces sp. MA3_2.13]UED87802.1 hypothetical protein K4G22_29370 [Streptomyces sp. MA3_2.13]
MMIYLPTDEIDLEFDQEDPLGLVAATEQAVRRHGVTLTDVGVDSRYMYLSSTDNVIIELGGCRGDGLRKLIRALNAAPVEDEPASEKTAPEEVTPEFCQVS